MDCRVCAFTDTYLPTINGVSYTVNTWRNRWQSNGRKMSIVFPNANGYQPADDEFPVGSLPFPFYEGYRLGLPTLPAEFDEHDIVHAHTPFSLGLAALRQVRRDEQPLVASFHTPCGEYTQYLSPSNRLNGQLSSISQRYERWFLEHADVVTAPTETAATYLEEELGITVPVAVVPNGVDLNRFERVDSSAFRERYDLPAGPLIGYTGRHGYEKRLHEIIEAVAKGPEDWSVVLSGEGPATDAVERLANELDVDLHCLGFLERDELPEFYSVLDVFAFPSPVETQGLVALESIVCGTPVVGIDDGALAETITAGETGYRYRPDDIDHFTEQLTKAIVSSDSLKSSCLDQRESLGLDLSIDALTDVYASVLENR